MKPVKCYYCSNLIYREKDLFERLNSGRYSHQACITQHQIDNQAREKLLSYITELFGERINFGVVTKQIKNYVDNFNYTYSGIHGTLYYCYSIKKQEINRAEGIGLVPYYYNEARRYWLQVSAAKDQDFTLQTQKKTVIISSPKSKPLIKYKPLTLEELEEEINE